MRAGPTTTRKRAARGRWGGRWGRAEGRKDGTSTVAPPASGPGGFLSSPSTFRPSVLPSIYHPLPPPGAAHAPPPPPRIPPRLPRVAPAGFLLAASTGLLLAQEPYHDPSPEIAKILDAAPAPLVVLSPDRTRLLIVERAGLPPISEVAAPELRLAGVRLNPRTNSLSRTQVNTGLIVAPIGAGEGRRIPMAAHARIGSAFWSPDGRRIAFTLIEEGGVSLRVVDVSGGESRALTGPVLRSEEHTSEL